MSNYTASAQVIQKYLEDLCVKIGERPVGSENNRKAQSYIGAVFRQNGYAVEFQEFDCIDWRGGTASLRLGTQPIPAAISPYSLPCNVTAGYELIGDIEHLAQCEVRNKIAVLYGSLTREAIMPKNFKFWNPEEHQRIVRLLETGRPKAIVTVSFNENLPTPIFEDADFEIPSVVISGKDSRTLFDSSLSPLSLKIESTRRPARAANVIARKSGKAGKKKVVLTAHLDTKPGTPGALDNASGIVTLLMLSRQLQAESLDIDLEFVAFNGEDYYSNAGEVTYLEQDKSEFSKILMNINCDGVGLKDSKIGVSYMACPDSLIAHFEEVRQGYDEIEVIDPWYQGDHMLFVMAEVPSLTVTSSNIFPLVDTVVHTEKDTPGSIDPEAIFQAAQYLSRVIEHRYAI